MTETVATRVLNRNKPIDNDKVEEQQATKKPAATTTKKTSTTK